MQIGTKGKQDCYYLYQTKLNFKSNTVTEIEEDII